MPAVSPFAWQSNKNLLFYFPLNSSLIFDSTLVYREAEVLASVSSVKRGTWALHTPDEAWLLKSLLPNQEMP